MGQTLVSNSLLSIQKDIFQHIKKRAQDIEVDASDELVKYRNDQAGLTDRPYEIVPEDQLIKSIEPAKVVYFGDFHTFDQNSRNVIRILRKSSQSKKLRLGLELVQSKDQESLSAFVQGHITEIEFLEAINYQESWRFPWGHYREIFKFAQAEDIPIIALNSEGSLTERDRHAAKLIHNELDQHPNETMVVLFGEYHIVKDKLPKHVTEVAKAEINQLIIHQNLDDLYWPLAESNQGHQLNVVKFSTDEFSIQSSPPWVKYESMLYWYENILEDPEFDIHEIILQSNAERFGENNDEIFIYLLNGVSEFFKNIAVMDKNEFEDFNLYDLDNFEFLNQKIEQDMSQELVEFYRKLIVEGMAFKIPLQNSFYCPNYSINQLSFLCGVFTLSSLSKSYKQYEEDFLKDPSKNIFSLFVQKSYIGFIGSKVINPYRKTDLYSDLPENSPIRKVIDQPENVEEILRSLSLYEKYFVAKRVGYICGDIAFNELLEATPKLFIELSRKFITERIDIKNFAEIIQLFKDQSNLLNSKKRLF